MGTTAPTTEANSVQNKMHVQPWMGASFNNSSNKKPPLLREEAVGNSLNLFVLTLGAKPPG